MTGCGGGLGEEVADAGEGGEGAAGAGEGGEGAAGTEKGDAWGGRLGLWGEEAASLYRGFGWWAGPVKWVVWPNSTLPCVWLRGSRQTFFAVRHGHLAHGKVFSFIFISTS
jgi:hypothetical protein